MIRYDNAPLQRAVRTPQGFLRAPARVTRAGVFPYTRDDGSVTHELRHPDDVFHVDSMASLASAPVTELHPGAPVDAANARDVMIGFGSEAPRRDGIFVESAITVTDAAAIGKIDSGSLKEVSLGYTAKILPEVGVYQGVRYDARQTEIRYNHIALGPSGWGRAGSEVSMRLDGGAARFDAPPTDALEKEHMDFVEIRVNGQTVTVAKVSADAVEKLITDSAQARADAVSATSALAKADAENGALKDRLVVAEAASAPAAITARIDARLAIVSRAVKVIGNDYRADGVSDADVMAAAVAKARPEMVLTGKSPEYVAAAFEFVCDSVGTASLGEARADAGAAPVVDTAAKARADRAARNAENFKNFGKVTK